jgi:hypothetical protein
MITTLLLVLAVACFAVAAIDPSPRWNRFIAAGLAFMATAMLLR